MSEILLKNKQFAEKYLMQSKFYNVVVKKENFNEKKIHDIFSCMKVLATYFQKMVVSRYLFHRDLQLQAIAKTHLVEELGHDDYFKGYKKIVPSNDVILESCCTWFIYGTIFEKDIHGSALMHLVIEESADIIMPLFKELVIHTLGKESEYLSYISLHIELDCNHSEMLNPFLENMNSSIEQKEELILIMEKGWQIINTIYERIYNVANLNI